MPTIHVIFDPRDLVVTPASNLKNIGASAAAMTINTEELEPEAIQETAEHLSVLLLNAIARDQE